ncbi:MAG: 50S ribosomal protein L23 [Pseudomonadota bacterium]
MSSKQHQARVYSVLLGPHISEKATLSAEKRNQVVFRVRKDATKPEIKQAVEQLFEVSVDHVRTVTLKGKTKSRGRLAGRRSDWKKAYVQLADGHDIDFLGME